MAKQKLRLNEPRAAKLSREYGYAASGPKPDPAFIEGLRTWGPDIAGLPGDLAGVLYQAGQYLQGKRGPNVKPLNWGDEARAKTRQRQAAAFGYAQPKRQQAELTAWQEPSGAETLVSLANPAFLVNPAAIARSPALTGGVGALLGLPMGGELGGMAGVVKPKGGNWMPGSLESVLINLKTTPTTSRTPEAFANRLPLNEWLPMAASETDHTPVKYLRHTGKGYLEELSPERYALNNWTDKQLRRYIQNEMATTEDPLRALAEQGVLHYAPNPHYADKNYLALQRAEAGFPAGGLGESELARNWENAADFPINRMPVSEALQLKQKIGIPIPEWMTKVPGETPMYGLDRPFSNQLGFEHLIDELNNAMNPASGLPQALQYRSPEALSKVTVPQAVQRVHDINQWRAEQQAIANQQLANNAATQLFKEYPENNPQGLRWVEFRPNKEATEDQRLRHALTGYKDNPDAALLPFVQDFVRSGEWGDVQDLENAGLLRREDILSGRLNPAFAGKNIQLDDYEAALQKFQQDLPADAPTMSTPDEWLKYLGFENFAEGGRVAKQDDDDFSTWTPEQLRAFVTTGALPAVAPQAAPAQPFDLAQAGREALAAEPGWKRALIGAGQFFSDVGTGVAELGDYLALPADQTKRSARLEAIEAARAERRDLGQALDEDTAAKLGNIGAQVATGFVAPARLGAQMAAQGVLSGLQAPSQAPSGLGGELASRAVKGATDAAITGAVGKGLQAVGKAGAAIAGKYTPEGAEALATDVAAKRLGLPSPTVGQLFPRSASAKIEALMPMKDDLVEAQAKALGQAVTKDTPYGVPDVGGKYLDELKAAVQQRYKLAADKYKAVDDLVAQQGLGPITPTYTARSVTAHKQPGYEMATGLLNRYGFDAQSMQGMPAAQLGKLPITFENYHMMRVATNKALNTLERGMSNAEKAGAAIPAENKAALNWLRSLKTALDNDVGAWSKKHAGNAEAMGLYKDATNYYKDIVAPTILENPLARKVASTRSGFKTGEEALRAATSTAGMPSTARLRPTMTPLGADMDLVLRNLPDARQMLLTGKAAGSPDAVGQALRAAMGHPITAIETAIGHVPGLQALTRSTAAKRLAAARSPFLVEPPSVSGRTLPDLQAVLSTYGRGQLPLRAAYGAAQVPAGSIEETIDKVLGRR